MAKREVVVQFLALHVGCHSCGAKARLVPDCDVYATWAECHKQPDLFEAEVLVDGEFRRRPIRPQEDQ